MAPRRATTALPIPMPSRNTSSTSVKAYVEPPTIITSTRVQAISSSRAAKAVRPSSSKAVLRRAGLGRSPGSRPGSGGTAVGASAREPESQSAIPPRARLMVAVAHRLARTPTYSIRKNPARAVPTTAPRAVGAAAEQPGAEPQATHVRGHHRRDGLDGGAERLIENPDPEELVYEPRRSGQEEEETVSAGGARTHADRASPARDPPLAAG